MAKSELQGLADCAGRDPLPFQERMMKGVEEGKRYVVSIPRRHIDPFHRRFMATLNRLIASADDSTESMVSETTEPITREDDDDGA